MSNHSFVDSYFERGAGQRDRRHQNLMIEGDVLFSYGRHFALAVPLKGGGYLLNGDRRSNSTSGHQSHVRSAIMRNELRSALIPFSALREAIGPGFISWAERLSILDTTEDEWREVPYKDPETGEDKIRHEHLLGSTLFEFDGAYYLSSTDPTGKWGRNYFLTKLKGEARTVAEAYEALKPGEVRDAEREGIEVQRQGEYFFIPATHGPLFSGAKPLRFNRRQVLHSEPLPPMDSRQHPHQHVPTETVKLGQITLVRGTVRHRGQEILRWDYEKNESVSRGYAPGDHKMLKLGKVWHIVAPNVQDGSWTVDGRVD